MGIDTDILADWHASHAALQWLHELGALDPVGDAPIDRYALAERDAAAPRDTVPRAQATPQQAAS